MNKTEIFTFKWFLLPLTAITITGGILMSFGLIQLLTFGLAYILFFFAYLFTATSKSSKADLSITAPAFRIEVLVKCTHCDYKEIKKFTPGDYVFKKLETCKQCNKGTLYIAGIYGIPLYPTEEESDV
ncbi:MAG: hypothetical protein J7L47_04110 [Candidatus Odinarchaeota archaeon]|nr:hypothetical protein [Candidatus Odinarchaeota archaeon]